MSCGYTSALVLLMCHVPSTPGHHLAVIFPGGDTPREGHDSGGGVRRGSHLVASEPRQQLSLTIYENQSGSQPVSSSNTH
ncbi:hypothetical protein Pmani_019450 [Petrolisthes manimaculis]|uniref:Uncharacterized protein n=1 Tax=Petrolisthes manimaculis TaxID=1843537 RepID=A0AAE1PI97_9EUCA|nr:hypothetical protein Pmani_019450 [Petrolisthes manimaculis]